MKRVIPIRPFGDGFGIRRDDLELSKRCIVPVDRTEQERNDLRTSLFVALDGSSHFGAVAIVRSHKVGTDQQQDDISTFQMLMEFFFPFHTSIEISIAPNRDLALSLQRHEVSF